MPDFTDLKKKHKATWALGEYDRLADGLHPAQDHVIRVARIRPGEKVLDVATGTGNTAIKARAHGGRVTGLDLTPELLEVARKKAESEGFGDIVFEEGDAERLPYADATFDVVLSTCGHMFAPDQERVGAEMVRVTKPGGRIVFMAWTPDGGLGRYFAVMNRHVPPPAGAPSTFHWGDPEHVRRLLGPGVREVRFETGDCTQYGERAEDVWNLFRTKYGPTVRAMASLDDAGARRLERDMLEFLRGYESRADAKVRWGREYLLTYARRA